MQLHEKIEFSLLNQNNEIVSSNDYLNQKLIIYVYPKDNTPGCTKEACNYRDNYQKLISKGYILFGLSKDSVSSHQKFKNNYQIPFPLLSDENLTIINKLGAYQEKTLYGKKYMGVVRSTFIFNENHELVYQNFKVKASTDAEDILKIIDSLN